MGRVVIIEIAALIVGFIVGYNFGKTMVKPAPKEEKTYKKKLGRRLTQYNKRRGKQ